jgi:HSP20 family protein
MSNLIQHPYQDLQTHPFKNMFDKFTHFLENGNMYSHIHVNLTEDDRAYYISADLPGVKESDINIELDQERLTISAKREDLHKDQKYHLAECFYGDFERTITLPSNIDGDKKVYAKYQNGVLHISIHKLDKSTTAKKIVIDS